MLLIIINIQKKHIAIIIFRLIYYLLPFNNFHNLLFNTNFKHHAIIKQIKRIIQGRKKAKKIVISCGKI